MRRALYLCSVLFGTFGVASCDDQNPTSYAFRIESPADLIGGPGAIGTLGDYMIGNQHIRVVLQDQGWSRGFAIFGGGIIDADIVRPNQNNQSNFGNGHDNFGEFFPALFLEAFDVADQKAKDDNGDIITRPGIEVIQDGRDGKAAIVRTRASGGDFLTLINVLDTVLPDPGLGGLQFEVDYILEPNARHLKIVGRLLNTSSFKTLAVPLDTLAGFLGLLGAPEDTEFQVPLGDVALFGEGNHVFAPGAVNRPEDPDNPKPVGFDLRFAMEKSYETPRTLPALPGLVTDFLATAGDKVSYGFAVGPSERNYIWLNQEEYKKDPYVVPQQHSLLVPFLFTSFTGAFYEVPPSTLEPLAQYEYTKYFIVGDGDVAAIRDELYEIRGTSYANFFGEVRDDQTGTPSEGAWVHIFDQDQQPYNQVSVDSDGRFRCRLEPGTYYFVLTAEGRYPHSGGETRFSETNQFTIGNDLKDVYRRLSLPRPAELVINVRDQDGTPLPAKVSALLPYSVPQSCSDCVEDNCDTLCAPRNYVFDLSLGEARRPTDLNWRNKTGSRDGQYIETVIHGHRGELRGKVRPSPCNTDVGGNETCTPYQLHISRGPEYSTAIIDDVLLKAGQLSHHEVTLRRVVDTEHYVAADLHIHAQPSVDSGVALEDRVISGVAEGLEVMVATDHNVITNYAPTIARLGLKDWVSSVVGVELSTLEMGHFNGFPLQGDPGAPTRFPYVSTCFEAQGEKVNGTSFDWVQCNPQQFIKNLRELGAYGPDNTIVQVNHPRDSILGYFNQYYVNPYTLETEEPSGDNYGSTIGFIRPGGGILEDKNSDDYTGQFEKENFSWDFDAIEVFNGKHFERIHAFKTPADAPASYIDEIQDYQCGTGHPNNEPGAILLEKGGHPAYPGTFDDWLRLLNRGETFTATGNSDSHSVAAEIGTPRTYLYVAPDENGAPTDDRPGKVDPLDVVDAIQKHRALVTNAPFLNMTVLTSSAGESGAQQTVIWRPGSTVRYASSNIGREVEVLFSIQSAPWVDVDKIVVWANGSVLDEIQIPDQTVVTGANCQSNNDCAPYTCECPSTGGCEQKQCAVKVDDNNIFKRTYTFNQDTVLVAEALGSESLFPVVTPKEVAPANISAALGSLLSSFGTAFGAVDGLRGPDPIQRVYPYAFTNPIWLDITGPNVDSCKASCGDEACRANCEMPDGIFNPPGNSTGPGAAPSEEPGACGVNNSCPAGQICNTTTTPAQCECPEESALHALPHTPALLLFTPPVAGQHYHRHDIRRVFAPHMGH